MDDMRTYYCQRIKKNVAAESMNDLTGRVFAVCKYYTEGISGSSRFPCIKDSTNRKCLVKLAVQKEIKVKLSS